MTFDELQVRLADWYDTTPAKLGLPREAVTSGLHPVLAEFYTRFGTLASQTDNPFKHPLAWHFPLKSQDQILPLADLIDQDGFTIFCSENQGIFCAAARTDAKDDMTYAMGDAVLHAYVPDFVPVDVPLEECLVTCALQETILSVVDHYPGNPAPHLEAYKALAMTGETIVSRYIWPDAPHTFHLSDEVWYMEHSDYQFAAHRGFWREEAAAVRARLRRE